MMAVMERVADRLELACDMPKLSETEYRHVMVVAITGIFLILMVFLSAFVMAASNKTPWEGNK